MTKDFDDHGCYACPVAAYERISLEELDAMEDPTLVACVVFGFFANRYSTVPGFRFSWRSNLTDDTDAVVADTVFLEIEAYDLPVFLQLDFIQRALRTWDYGNFTPSQLIGVLRENGYVDIVEYDAERRSQQDDIDHAVERLLVPRRNRSDR